MQNGKHFMGKGVVLIIQLIVFVIYALVWSISGFFFLALCNRKRRDEEFFFSTRTILMFSVLIIIFLAVRLGWMFFLQLAPQKSVIAYGLDLASIWIFWLGFLLLFMSWMERFRSATFVVNGHARILPHTRNIYLVLVILLGLLQAVPFVYFFIVESPKGVRVRDSIAAKYSEFISCGVSALFAFGFIFYGIRLSHLLGSLSSGSSSIRSHVGIIRGLTAAFGSSFFLRSGVLLYSILGEKIYPFELLIFVYALPELVPIAAQLLAERDWAFGSDGDDSKEHLLSWENTEGDFGSEGEILSFPVEEESSDESSETTIHADDLFADQTFEPLDSQKRRASWSHSPSDSEYVSSSIFSDAFIETHSEMI